MKKMLFILLAVLGLASCRQDGDELGRSGNQASKETKLVSLNLSGDLELPFEDLVQQGKALTLVPNTKGGKSVLTPTFDEGDQVAALCYVTSLDKTQSSAALPVTLTAKEGGTKLSFFGDVPVPTSMLNGQNLLLSVFVGFNPDGTLKEYPTSAPYYAKSGTRTPITNYPIALQAKAQIDYKGQAGSTTTGSYRNLALKFKLVGSLIRCAIKNETDRELTVKALELHGLGAEGIKLAKPTSGSSQETFVTSDKTDPANAVRLYTLPTPVKLLVNGEVGYYIVYAPLVSKEDGRNIDYKGYIRPILSDATLQAEYSGTQTPKVLPQDRMGKLALTTIILKEKGAISPDGIPLQYWNAHIYYRGTSGAKLLTLSEWPGAGATYGNNGSYSFTGNIIGWEEKGFYFRPDEVTPAEVTSLGQGVHIPTAAELDGVFLPETFKLDPARNSVPDSYSTASAYNVTKLEDIEVGKKRIAGSGSYWRGALESQLGDNKLRTALFWSGALSRREPVYALRFGKLSPADVAAYKAKGFKDSEIAQDDKSRVAYMYTYNGEDILVYSCYIGENDEIRTAEDLKTKNVFGNADNTLRRPSQAYKGAPIYGRTFPYFAAQYSAPNVNSGARRYPSTRQSFAMPRSYNGIYTNSPIPSRYLDLVTPPAPPSGILRLNKRGDTTLESVWIHRADEGQFDPTVNGWQYESGLNKYSAVVKSFAKDLPKNGGYFVFPLYLLSDKPTTTLYQMR